MVLFPSASESLCPPSLQKVTRIVLKDSLKATTRVKRLSQGNHTTFRKLITEALLEGLSQRPLEKSAFLFSDRVTTPDETLYINEHKWFRK